MRTPVKEFFFPEDQNFIYEEFFPRVQREGRAEVEIRFRHFKTGEPLWMIYNVFHVLDAEGRPVGLATVSRDITERKRSEAALRETTRRFQTIADHAPVAIYVKDREGRYVFGNRKLAQYTGRPVERLLGRTDYDFAPKEDADRWRENDLKVLEGQAAEYEETGIDRDGHPYVNLSVKFPLSDDAGTEVEICGISMDITERKRMESRLAADMAALTRIHALSGRLLDQGGLHPLLQEVMDAAVAIVGAERGTLQLIEDDSLRIVAHHAHKQPFLDFFAAAENRASVCGEALQRGQRVIVPDVETDSLFAGTPSLPVLREAGVRAVQSTPMVSRTGSLLGILTTQWSVPHWPDEHDLWRVQPARTASGRLD